MNRRLCLWTPETPTLGKQPGAHPQASARHEPDTREPWNELFLTQQHNFCERPAPRRSARWLINPRKSMFEPPGFRHFGSRQCSFFAILSCATRLPPVHFKAILNLRPEQNSVKNSSLKANGNVFRYRSTQPKIHRVQMFASQLKSVATADSEGSAALTQRDVGKGLGWGHNLPSARVWLRSSTGEQGFLTRSNGAEQRQS